jgi:tetratricopeptide (TPR) repeat protein
VSTEVTDRVCKDKCDTITVAMLPEQDSLARAKSELKSAGKDLPDKREEYGNALAAKGRYAQALREYLWCLDVGMQKDQGYSGVRRSFLLSNMMDLGQKYPPALAALRIRRDQARTALIKGVKDPEVAYDFASYNDYIGNPAQTLALYDSLKARGGPVAKALFEVVRRMLLENQRYADLLAGYGDASKRADQAIGAYNRTITDSRVNKDPRNMYLAGKMKLRTRQACEEIYEALLGTNRIAEAVSVRDKVLVMDRSLTTFSDLIFITHQANQPKEAVNLRELARAALSSSDFRQVEQATK